MLILAASAALEQMAGRLDAIWGRFEHLGEARVHSFADVDADFLSGEDEGCEDHSAVDAGEAFAAVDPLVHSD